MSLRYHITVTSALQQVVLLARLSPMVATITAPLQKAEQVAHRQAQQYPTITATPNTRSALRAAGLPAIQLVVMPPDSNTVTMFLLSNVIPQDSREVWRNALDPHAPLTWRNYSLTTTKTGSVTWRLSQQARDHYRQRLARLITGRGGVPQAGQRPYMMPDETARTQVLKLAEHLHRYPGFSGVRADVFDLAQHSTKLWRNTRPNSHYPVWPRQPNTRFSAAQTAPIDQIHPSAPDTEV